MVVPAFRGLRYYDRTCMERGLAGQARVLINSYNFRSISMRDESD
jgi:hypothetical protein